MARFVVFFLVVLLPGAAGAHSGGLAADGCHSERPEYAIAMAGILGARQNGKLSCPILEDRFLTVRRRGQRERHPFFPVIQGIALGLTVTMMALVVNDETGIFVSSIRLLILVLNMLSSIVPKGE